MRVSYVHVSVCVRRYFCMRARYVLVSIYVCVCVFVYARQICACEYL